MVPRHTVPHAQEAAASPCDEEVPVVVSHSQRPLVILGLPVTKQTILLAIAVVALGAAVGLAVMSWLAHLS